MDDEPVNQQVMRALLWGAEYDHIEAHRCGTGGTCTVRTYASAVLQVPSARLAPPVTRTHPHTHTHTYTPPTRLAACSPPSTPTHPTAPPAPSLQRRGCPGAGAHV